MKLAEICGGLHMRFERERGDRLMTSSQSLDDGGASNTNGNTQNRELFSEREGSFGICSEMCYLIRLLVD